MCYESCSSFATNTSVVMKAGSVLLVEMQRKSEGKACVCVCVSLCWWQWECLLLGPPPPLQIYSTSLPNAELRSPAPPTARPNTHSVFFILSFSQSHSSLCSLSSSWPRLPSLSRQESLKLTETKRWREKGEIELGTSAHT